MGKYTNFYMFENPRRGMQARNFATNVPKILDLKSSSEQIFFRKLSLGASVPVPKSVKINFIMLPPRQPRVFARLARWQSGQESILTSLSTCSCFLCWRNRKVPLLISGQERIQHACFFNKQNHILLSFERRQISFIIIWRIGRLNNRHFGI